MNSTPFTCALATAMILGTSALVADAEPWAPPAPAPDEFDWVKLTSGEWLKGEFKGMYDDSVKFDSDILGLLELDWEDIEEVRAVNPKTMRFENDVHAAGPMQIEDDTVKVQGDSGEESYERDDLIAIATDSEREIDLWEAQISVGATYRSGNTDEKEFSATAEAMRRTEDSRLLLKYRGRYLESDGIETQNSHQASARYDRFLSQRFFWTPFLGQYNRDPFQNFAHRVTLGAGVGYQIIDTSKTEWTVMAGPAYRYTEFDSVEAGHSRSESSFGGVLISSYERELTDWLDFDADYSGYLMGSDSGGYGHSASSGLSFDIADPFEFQVSVVWDYIQDPAREADGHLPERSDFWLILGLGVEF